jgi:hypothetical protein
MQGTGFDQEINDLHAEFGGQLRADNIPFVTALAARDGKVFDYRVRTPSSASLPPTADYFKPAETNAVPTVAAATNLPPPDVVVPQPDEPPRREIVLKPEPLPATNPPPVPASATTEPVVPEKPESALPSAPPPVLQPDTRGGARLSAAVIQPAPMPPIQPAPPQAQPAPAPVQTPSTIAAPANAPANSQPEIRNPQSNENELTEGNKDNEGKPLSPSLPSFASAQNPQSAIRGSTARLSSPKSELAEVNPQSVVAVALPAPANHRALLATAISLLAIVVVLSLLLIRRSRAAPSLISQSMNRPK